SAVSNESQHAAQVDQVVAYVPPGSAPRLARCGSTRAVSARWNVRNVAGGSNPANPEPRSMGNVVPPACRALRAESRMATTALYAESLVTTGDNGPRTGRLMSIGIESSVWASSTMRSASAWIVWTNPRTAFFSGSLIWAEPITLRMV